jgi:hypothetical protein
MLNIFVKKFKNIQSNQSIGLNIYSKQFYDGKKIVESKRGSCK